MTESAFSGGCHCLDGPRDVSARFTVKPFDGAEWEANVEKIR